MGEVETVGGKDKIREERLIELIKALGHPLRINILRMLRENLSRGVRYSRIAERVKKKGGALDFHLNTLKKPLLIKSEKGVYHLSDAGIKALNFFDELLRRRKWS
jgi:DNA-binding transcriptional ArsR family regulator